MKNNDRTKLFVISILFVFFISAINIKNYYAGETSSNKIESEKSISAEPISEKPPEIEQPKTADISQEQQEHNFSLSINIDDAWNKSWYYENYNSTKNVFVEPMRQLGTEGYNVTYYLYVSDLTNQTSGQLISPNDLTTMRLWVHNGTPQKWVELGQISDRGLGKGFKTGFLHLNKSVGGYFAIFNNWAENVNVTYNATMVFRIIPYSYNITTKFNPTVENTQSNEIEWQFNLQKSSLTYFGWDYYIKINLNEEFTLIRALGIDDTYWIPVETIRTSTEIVLNETYNDYLVEVESLNYISIVYNNNLSFSNPYNPNNNNNELKLYATCKMAGNLTIRFGHTNGTTLYFTKLVEKDEEVPYNFKMRLNDTGGITSLNVTLTDNLQYQFGVKICEVIFHKNTILDGMTGNTTAFSQFFVALAYIDFDLLSYYSILNDTGQINIGKMEMLNLTVIPDATVTYELGEFQGELSYSLLGRWYETPNITVYWDQLDLSEYQIPPGEYHIIYRANRPGYQSFLANKTIIISKKGVDIEFLSNDDTIPIEDDFMFVLNLFDGETRQNFLMTPIMINFTFVNNDTKEVEDEGQWPFPAIQSITIQDTIGNKTPHGTYNLTFYIISEYYYGEISSIINVVKKNLAFSFAYDDDDIEEEEEFDVSWSLENGGFNGNRENMSVEIFVDGGFFASYDLSSGSGGVIKLELDDGEHTITCSLISPFYSAETTITIDVEEKEEEEPTWMEENWIFLLVGIITIIAMVVLALFLLISRQKMKAQRELDSELMALKNKALSTEQRISLIETQIAQIASIYWVLVVHSEQGTTMVEIVDFKFEDVLSEEEQYIIGKGTIRDSALIGGFLTAIRNFSRETSGESQDYQPIFNSETDYTTVVDDTEIHRRILEGTDYFMGFVSSMGTIEISDVLSNVNLNFNENYGIAAKSFDGAVLKFKPFVDETITYLHDEIRKLQKKLDHEKLVLEKDLKNLNEVQDKIGIVKKSGSTYK